MGRKRESGDDMNYSLQEIADELHVTTTRVRQIERLAMRNFIRNAMRLRLYDSISELAGVDGKKTIFEQENENDR